MSDEVKKEFKPFNRLKSEPRNIRSVATIISAWGRGQGNKMATHNKKLYDEYCEIWNWLVVRAKRDGLNLEEMPITAGGVRLTLEYVRRVLRDEMMEYTQNGFMEYCLVQLDDYLRWYESDMAKFVFRSEQLFEQDRIKSQKHLVRKKLIEGIKSGDEKSIKMFLDMTGLTKAGEPDEEGYQVINIKKYLDDKGKEVV